VLFADLQGSMERLAVCAPEEARAILDPVLPYLREAQTLAETLNDHRQVGLISAYIALYCWVTADYDRTLEFGHRALALAREDIALQAPAHRVLGQAYHALADYHRVLECFRRNREALTGGQLREETSLVGLPPGGGLRSSRIGLFNPSMHTWLVWCLAELGAFAEGLARAEAGVQAAEAGGDLDDRATAAYGLGLLYLRNGDFQKAASVLERGFRLCQGGSSRSGLLP
jgi:tetratricopeptide (TPR) repeat protein